MVTLAFIYERRTLTSSEGNLEESSVSTSHFVFDSAGKLFASVSVRVRNTAICTRGDALSVHTATRYL